MIAGLIRFTGFPGVVDAQEFVPERKSDGAVGYDIKACRVLHHLTREEIGSFPLTIKPGKSVLIGIGVIMAIPEGVDAQVRPRSGLAAKYGIILANGPGTIDPDYRGEVACALQNFSDVPYAVQRGDRIAQLIFTPILLPEFEFVPSKDDLPFTRRNDGGFGSTGTGQNEGFGTELYKRKIHDIDVYMMRIVLATADRSNCVRGCPKDELGRALRDEFGHLIGQTRKLGCVIARDDRIIASGFNTQYPGAPLCAEVGCMREKLSIPSGQRLEECRAIHAEGLALINAARDGASVVGCTLYCNAEPCLSCARSIAGMGLEALVVLEGGYSSNQGLEIVKAAGIKVRSIKL